MTEAAALHPEYSIDQAIGVLRKTSDGDDLAPRDLALLQLVVNAGGLSNLSEAGVARWHELCKSVNEGTYVRPWFHDVENLTKNHEGYVMWRGKTVEHYSFPEDRAAAEKVAAQRLGAECARLERDGIQPGSSALWGLSDRMRLAGELGAGVSRYLATWEGSNTQALNFRIHVLCAEDDAGLSSEVEGIVQGLREQGGSSGARYASHMLLVTKEDFNEVVQAIERAVSWSRSMAWRAGELTPDHALFPEPQASLRSLESQVKRDSLVDLATVQQKYLGGVFIDPAPEPAAEVAREICR